MKLSLKRDPAIVLATARAKRAELATKLVELTAARAAALLDTDDVDVVRGIDNQIDQATRDAGVLDDRTAALELIVRERATEERERLRQAALVEVQKRLDAQVKLAVEVEDAVKLLGERWGKLLQWRSAILRGWPEGLPLPPAGAFVDQRGLIRELAVGLHEAGRPRWDKPTSIPNSAPSIPVAGLEPRGLSAFVREAGAAFIARMRSTRVQPTGDDVEAA